jgi:hypothetical protein
MVAAEGPARVVQVKVQVEGEAAAVALQVLAPGGRVEDDSPALRQVEPAAHLLGALVSGFGVAQQVVARVAGLQQFALVVEGAPHDGRAEAVG